MTSAARALRILVTALAVGVSGGPAAASLAAPPVAAAELSIRLEAGPQASVTFDASWRVTSRSTVTLKAPQSATASSRRSEPVGGTWLRVSSGLLAGRWVRESAVAHITGLAGTTTFAPARSLSLTAGRWELYRFDATGQMVEAKGWHVTSATTVSVDRAAVVRGLRHVRVASGTWAGWWIPGSRTAPRAISCTTGRPPSGTEPVVVRSVAAATGEIALTFDMGGRLDPALSILRYLELHRVCATIFPTGAMATTDTGRTIMAEIRAHPELFELGNHTVHHCNLRDGGGGSACPASRPSAAFISAELRDADEILWSLGGSHTAPYWRPPYGASDAAVRQVAADAGYPYTMMWSTDTIDWKRVRDGGPTAAQTAAKVIAERKAGAVVLMHLGGYTTRNALPAMITGLRAVGYTPTSISALYRSGH